MPALPLEMRSTVAAAFATNTGCISVTCNVLTTAIRSVTAATAPAQVNASMKSPL